MFFLLLLLGFLNSMLTASAIRTMIICIQSDKYASDRPQKVANRNALRAIHMSNDYNSISAEKIFLKKCTLSLCLSRRTPTRGWEKRMYNCRVRRRLQRNGEMKVNMHNHFSGISVWWVGVISSCSFKVEECKYENTNLFMRICFFGIEVNTTEPSFSIEYDKVVCV